MDVVTGLEVWVETEPITGLLQYNSFLEINEQAIKLSDEVNVSSADQIMDSESQEEEVKTLLSRSIPNPKNALELQPMDQRLARPVTRKVRGRSIWASVCSHESE
tara:strand:+ start:399 stop:713 length:315 start_codon:yes stop_codon:yes gene_type:complete